MPPALPTDGPVLSPPPATDGPLPVTPPPPLPHAKFASGKDVAGGPWQATPVSGDSPAAVSHAPAAAAGPGVGSHSVSITENYAIGLEVLDPEDLAPEERMSYVERVIGEYKNKLQHRTAHHMGYPYNLDFDYGPLEDLTRFSINNLGDPFIESNYGVHSREFEVGVLQWFAKLWEIEQDDFWGYITNCGTEGNLHGILTARENHPDGILYTSKETHYSVAKAARMYRMDFEEISTLPSGEINYDEFEQRVRANVGRPAIVNVNIGTTVKGAVDDLDRVLQILADAGYSEDRFYIHCDGALFGLMIPFVKSAPMVSFKKPIGSISVSGHKFMGSPVPCGVVITRKSHIMAMASNVEYLNSRDATIMGSRNGHAPIYMWYTLTKKGYAGMRKDVEKCLRNAHVLKSMLESAGIRVMLNDLSSTVVFERPEDLDFVRKWQLACEGDVAHVVVMPNIGIDKLQHFVRELIESRASVALGKASAIAEVAQQHETRLAC